MYFVCVRNTAGHDHWNHCNTACLPLGQSIWVWGKKEWQLLLAAALKQGFPLHYYHYYSNYCWSSREANLNLVFWIMAFSSIRFKINFVLLLLPDAFWNLCKNPWSLEQLQGFLRPFCLLSISLYLVRKPPHFLFQRWQWIIHAVLLREFTNTDISVHSPLSVIQSFKKFGGKPPHTFFNKKKIKSIFSSGSIFIFF